MLHELIRAYGSTCLNASSSMRDSGPEYRYAPHNDVSVNDETLIRQWSHKIIILYYIIIPLYYHCLQYSVQ